jgi:hypothetical protein
MGNKNLAFHLIELFKDFFINVVYTEIHLGQVEQISQLDRLVPDLIQQPCSILNFLPSWLGPPEDFKCLTMNNSQKKTVNLILQARETVEDLHNRESNKAAGTKWSLMNNVKFAFVNLPALSFCFKGRTAGARQAQNITSEHYKGRKGGRKDGDEGKRDRDTETADAKLSRHRNCL